MPVRPVWDLRPRILEGSPNELYYRDATGLLVPVAGTATPGQVPTKQADGTWAYETPAGGGGAPVGQSRLERWAVKLAQGTTPTTMGLTMTGTGTVSNADAVDGCFAGYATSGTINTIAGYIPSGGTFACRPDWNPHMTMRLKTGADVSSVRLWAGLWNQTPSGIDDNASYALACFRYSTAVDGTAFWRAASRNLASSAMLTTTTDVPVTVDTAYTFRILLTTTSAAFYIDDLLKATHLTDVPPSGTTLGVGVVCTTLTASTRTVRISRIYMTHT